MKRLIPSAALAVALIAGAGRARADGEGFIEPGHHRLGWHTGLSFGGATLIGLGDLDGFGGRGGGLSFRVGTTASREFLWLLQVDLASYIVEELTQERHLNIQSMLTLGGQLYVRERMWVRAGAGIAFVSERAKQGAQEEADAVGLGWASSLGVDVSRIGPFVFDLEVVLNGGIYRGGVVTQAGLQLGFNFYGLRRED